MFKQLANELEGMAETFPDGIAVHGKISKPAWDELMRVTADKQPVHECPPSWAASPKHPVILWRFADAPAELQSLAARGGDEDWIILSPDFEEVKVMFYLLERVDEWDDAKIGTCRHNNVDHFFYVIQH